MTNIQPQEIKFAPQQLAAIHNKHGEQNQLIFATMLKFFEEKGVFPARNQIPDFQKKMIEVSKYLQVDLTDFVWPPVKERVTSRHFSRVYFVAELFCNPLCVCF